MRLEKIKLAGFKSFVDPTTILLESDLTAIVGPNGCGKSNIVDAIRWVIGESSAKQLRGALLTDVIFNGSTHRKPVGKASIELVFNNAERKAGAAYANYNEISVKRDIARDGQSNFYLNNTKCRKRDITDLFLGTGLGGYAIIEQGVIAQLIECKPEELRTHFEEAAGISKYRERRKETETRIRNTRENLERLADLREELQKQLERLKRQASAAERFKVLKQTLRLLKAQSHALAHRVISRGIEEQNQHLNAHLTLLEEQIAELRRIELGIEQARVEQTEAQQHFQRIQANFYTLGTDIAKKEQDIKNVQQTLAQLTKDLEEIARTWQDAETHHQEDTMKLSALETQCATMKPEAEQAKEVADQAQAALAQAEEAEKSNQASRDTFHASFAQVEQRVKLGASQLHHLAQKIADIEARIHKLKAQYPALQSDVEPEEIERLTERASMLSTTLDTLQAGMNASNEAIRTQRQMNLDAQAERDRVKQRLQELHHKRVALEALQQAALKKHDAGTEEWLKQHGWSAKTRLMASLEVESGWETAVETVLAPYLEAICVESTQDFNVAVDCITQGRLTLLNTAVTKSMPLSPNTLALKIKTPTSVHHLLNGIYVAEKISDALEMLASLQDAESVITRDGIWLSPHWLRIDKAQDETSGILQRQHSLKEISEATKAQECALACQEEQVSKGQEALSLLEENRDNQQREFQETSTQHSELRAKLSAKQAELAQIQKRKAALDQDLEEQQVQLSQAQAQLADAQAQALQSQTEYDAHQAQKTALLQAQDLEKAQLNVLRGEVRARQQAVDEYTVRLTSLENEQHYLRQNLTRTQKQLDQFEGQREALHARKESLSSPLPDLEEALQACLKERLHIEKDLNDAREQVTQSGSVLTTLEKQRGQVEEKVQEVRSLIEKIRIEQGSAQTHLENHLAHIFDAGYTLAEAHQELPEDATHPVWQEKIAEIDLKIQRLGPINLAAIEEFEESSQRKTYLDSQDKDLCDALSTLETTIQKIDQESRVRLRETFEKANGHFKALFTKMFNGGHAELEFVGVEVLTAGILIRAQPPGKRNTLLHMLSGGEKALTAIALVFALFQLNPAPFCVLDEVDAPLDDANVGRFCRLVEAMSSSVQFLFISHNKVTMEMAKQLVGVTMHEPGTSRIVSVDIDQAIAAIGET